MEVDMARPSMAEQRKEEILDAFELCILEKGIQATSLEFIAEKAKMKRTILRHYLGNKDEIIAALSQRWALKYQLQWQQTLAWLPDNQRVEAIIEILFTPRTAEYVNETIIGEALFSEAKRLESIKQDQHKNIAAFIHILTTELCAQFPSIDNEKLVLVAYSIHANYLVSESLLPLGLQSEVAKLKQASLLIIKLL
jgi:AcrR family transcriptional regulator